MTSVLAIDLGGSSGRAVLAEISKNGQIKLKEVTRFGDYMITNDQKVSWDFSKLMNEIKKAIKLAEKITPNFDSLAVNTWGVDFGVLDDSGQLKTDPRAYRDSYTNGMFKMIPSHLSKRLLYLETGIQSMEINTLFQILAQKKLGLLEVTDSILLMPDLINYHLTGEKKTELTIASTTQLLNGGTKEWSENLLESLELNSDLLYPIVKPGTILGELSSELCEELEITPKKVIAVGSHDTASAVFSIPNLENSFFLSSGTWSLLGATSPKPYLTDRSFGYQFSHEQGVEDDYLILKNLTGLWLIEELKRDYKKQGITFSFDDITKVAKESRTLSFYFDTDDSELALPGNCIEKLKNYALKTGQESPTTPGEFFLAVYHNLALKYRKTFEELEELMGVKKETLAIVGGGSNAAILNQLTANYLGKKVYAGLPEATVVGNTLLQFITLGKVPIDDKEKLVKESFDFTEFCPEEGDWNTYYQDYINKMEGL